MRVYRDKTVDEEFRILGSDGFSGSLNDRQFNFLRALNFKGTVSDMLYAWATTPLPVKLFELNEQGVWFEPDAANLDWRRNLLTRTEEFDNAVWEKNSCTVTPLGGGVWRLQAAPSSTFSLVFRISSPSAVNHNIAFDIKDNSAGSANIFRFILLSTLASSNISASSDWQRYSFSGAFAGTSLANGIIRDTSNAAVDILIRFPQLELGSTATAYQKVTSTFDVTEAGQPDNYFLSFDGIDDSMSTPSIDFTGTDKMTVFAGVRKLSDAAAGALVELSATIASNNGAFHLTAPNAASSTYAFESKGTNLTDAVGSATAPVSSILVGIGDISGDNTTLRINAAQADQDTGDQGTGNYGNYPLFIGARNNASLRFNGQLYSLIVRGAQTDLALIQSTERYVANRTAGVSI